MLIAYKIWTGCACVHPKNKCYQKRDKYPLLRNDDLLYFLSQAISIKSIDLTRGYRQIQMDDDKKQKNTFNCHQGLFILMWCLLELRMLRLYLEDGWAGPARLHTSRVRGRPGPRAADQGLKAPWVFTRSFREKNPKTSKPAKGIKHNSTGFVWLFKKRILHFEGRKYQRLLALIWKKKKYKSFCWGIESLLTSHSVFWETETTRELSVLLLLINRHFQSYNKKISRMGQEMRSQNKSDI